MDSKEMEKEKSDALKKLMDDWCAQISTKPKIVFKDDGKKYPAEAYFARDGFFPGYFSQKPKVLFIGRETRWIGGGDLDFRDTSIDYFTHDNVNTSSFWRRVLYILYGIRHNGNVLFEEIPCADEIAKEMVESGNFGFAVMNLSKYSNDSKTGDVADLELMTRFVQDSEFDKRNFFQEELELLEPDIIITANLFDGQIGELSNHYCFIEANWSPEIDSPLVPGQIANHWKYKVGGKEADLINLYHFSARNLADQDYFYDPVMKLLFPKER